MKVKIYVEKHLLFEDGQYLMQQVFQQYQDNQKLIGNQQYHQNLKKFRKKKITMNNYNSFRFTI